MKVSYANIVLNPSGENPKNFSVDTRRECQTENTIDASKASIFDRKNSRVNVQFSVERSHKSERDAELFALRHAANLSEKSPATLAFAPNGAPENIFEISGAVLSRVKTQTNSLTTLSSYEFTGASAQERA